MISVPLKSVAPDSPRRGARAVPLDRRAQRTPIGHDHLTGIEPFHARHVLAAATQVGREQRRGPQLAVACHQVMDVLRRRAHQARGLQDAGQIRAVLVETGQPFGGPGLVEQRVGDHLVTVAQRLQAVRHRRILLLGCLHQVQQRVGHALAGREHDAQARMGLCLDDVRHPREAGRIRDARAPELVDDPGRHAGGFHRFDGRSCCLIGKNPRTVRVHAALWQAARGRTSDE